MPATAEGFLQGLGLASLAAAGLILVILALRRLAPAGAGSWRMALWMILVLRMATAWAPLPSWTLPVLPATPAPVLAVPAAPVASLPPVLAPAPAPVPALPWPALLLVLWGLGAAALLLRTVQGNVRLWRAVRRGRVLTREPVLDLLERCKEELGVRTVLGIVVTEQVPSPALFGLLRPRLLLPPQVLATLSEQELRHVFLHELAHLKRWDILASWACALLQVVHWFNPLVWLGFRRLRGDRELACDQLALRALPATEAGAYGRTLITLMELLAPPPPLPSLAGVVEEAGTFKWRIKMIAAFRQDPGHRRWRPLAAALLGAFTLAAFAFDLDARGDQPLRPLLARPIQDKVDYPFVDDPQVIGTWRVEDFVPKPEAFSPGRPSARARAIIRKWEKVMPFMMPFSVRPGGGTSSVVTWTKGLFLNSHEVERTASRYELRTFAGTDYLCMEFKNGDYTFRGMTPEWVIFRREARTPVPASRVVDKVDYPFVDDPALRGTWRSVDFVPTPEAYVLTR